MITATTNWVEEIGKPAFETIREMVDAFNCDFDRLEELRAMVDYEEMTKSDEDELAALEAAAGDCQDSDDAYERIQEDPLEIELGGWWAPGSEPDPTEYRILLTTGGPAVRIVGEIGQSAVLQVQDWGKPWTDYIPDESDYEQVLLDYVACLYLGE